MQATREERDNGQFYDWSEEEGGKGRVRSIISPPDSTERYAPVSFDQTHQALRGLTGLGAVKRPVS